MPPLSYESSLPCSRAVGGLRLEVSLGTWEPNPFLYPFFSIGNYLLLFCIAKS